MESIWVLAMISKPTVRVIAVLILFGLSAAGESPEAFVESVFGEVPALQKIRLSGEIKTGVKEAYGRRYPGFSVSYWQKGGQNIWTLKASGKHGFIHAGLVTRQGRLIRIKILSSKEQWGRSIETFLFLDQFNGAGLKGGSQLDRRIDGISGATYSVNAVKRMARAALYLDTYINATLK